MFPRNFFRRDIALLEEIVLIVLALMIIPANVSAINKFKKKRLNKTFFTLIVALCCCNFCMCFIGIVTGLSRYMDQHPFGQAGCYITIAGLAIVTTATVFIQALISYERRQVITKVSVHTFHYRVYILLALIIAFSVVFWVFYFHFDGLSFYQVRYDKNSTATYGVCDATAMRMVGKNEIIFTMIGFFIPTAFILFNYSFVKVTVFFIFLF